MVGNKKRIIIFMGCLFLYIILSSINVLASTNNASYERLVGSNRYETSAAISKAGFPWASSVIIASGTDYPGALLAVSLSKLKNAPILLTAQSGLNPAVISEIKRLRATRAFIIGNNTIISSNVDKQLKGLGMIINRIDGADNYDISMKIADITGTKNGIIIAGKADFTEMLSIAPAAAIKTIPILPAPKDALNSKISSFIKGKTPSVSYLVGGTNILDASIEKQLTNCKRIGGSDIYQNNINIIMQFQSSFNFDTIYLASGKYIADALSGSALAAKNNAPILFTDGNSISKTAMDFVKSKRVKHIVILGGTDVINDNAAKTLSTALLSSIIHVTSMKLNITSSTLKTGEAVSLAAAVSPQTAANKTVLFASSNNTIATVDAEGKVKAVSTGSAIITAITTDGNFTSSCVINVVKPVVKVVAVNLNKTSTSLKVGEEDNLIGTVSPDNATNKGVLYTSSDNKIATVDVSGKISALAKGTAVITAVSEDGNKTASCAVTVIDPVVNVTAITLSKSTDALTIGSADKLSASVYPDNATNKYITFKSSDQNVAAVDFLGNVKAVSTGSAIITAFSADGNYSAACYVEVTSGQDTAPIKKPLTFAIDIGHNAKYDSGAVGIKSEDVLTMEVGTRVIEKLTELGYTAIDCTPTNSTSQTDALKQRVDIANAAHADYYVSIHFNKFNGIANGSEIYMGSSRIKDKARHVLDNLVSLGYANRGLKDNSSGLYVLKHTLMPAMLVECAFVDSADDMARYDPDAIADALVNGLTDDN